MATPIKRIEKDFLLKVLYDEQLPILYLNNRTEYILYVEKPPKEDIRFKSDRPIAGLKPPRKLELMFDYRGQAVMFSVDIISAKEEQIIAEAPEFLYKNLARSFSRIQSPDDLSVQFSFLGDRYSLSFPKLQEYEPGIVSEMVMNVDPKNLSGLTTTQLPAMVKEYASSYKLVMFKDKKPSSLEERIVAETGKTLFIPSTLASLPQEDPYPRKRTITEDVFRRFLESNGVDPVYLDDTLGRFLKHKSEKNIISEAWVPVLFQEYVIGYIHIWVSDEGRPPLNYEVLDTLYQFTKVFAFSLKINGYFNTGRIKDAAFDGKIIDVSVSGMLFAYPHSNLAAAMLPDSELKVKLIAPQRTIDANARIIRRYRDKTMGYFGCRFIDIKPEDMRFLFEYIYGKQMTDSDTPFLTGQV